MVDEKTTTTIEVSRENWQKLSGQKWPGESFDDVIGRLLVELGDDDQDPGGAGPSERRETAESGGGEKIRCEHCGNVWTTQSAAERPSCSSCGYKTDRLSP